MNELTYFIYYFFSSGDKYSNHQSTSFNILKTISSIYNKKSYLSTCNISRKTMIKFYSHQCFFTCMKNCIVFFIFQVAQNMFFYLPRNLAHIPPLVIFRKPEFAPSNPLRKLERQKANRKARLRL